MRHILRKRVNFDSRWATVDTLQPLFDFDCKNIFLGNYTCCIFILIRRFVYYNDPPPHRRWCFSRGFPPAVPSPVCRLLAGGSAARGWRSPPSSLHVSTKRPRPAKPELHSKCRLNQRCLPVVTEPLPAKARTERIVVGVVKRLGYINCDWYRVYG